MTKQQLFNRNRTYIQTILNIILVISFLPLMLQAKAAYAAETAQTPNIIGGDEAEEGAWPWIVGIVDANKESAYWGQFCGGSLIDAEWVLTAAHCTYKGGKATAANEIHVVLGTNSLTEPTIERIPVAQIIRHASYIRTTGDSDIALLKLARPTTHPTVKLATAHDLSIMASESEATVIGWGRTEDSSRVDKLRQVNVPVTDQEVCRTAYELLGYGVTDNMLCAGYELGGKDACIGDSGGPLVAFQELTAEDSLDESSVDGSKEAAGQWVQIGVVSWGKGCAEANAYGVYAKVSQFKDWIDAQITINSGNADAVQTLGGQSVSGFKVYMPFIGR